MRVPEELEVFGIADDLVLRIYALTSRFPQEERYGLTSQIRRAAVSIPSNLAEGCSRESQADFRRFVEIALGSSMELRYQLSVARRLDWDIPIDTAWKDVEEDAHRVGKMLASLGKALRARISGSVPNTQEPEDPVPPRKAL